MKRVLRNIENLFVGNLDGRGDRAKHTQTDRIIALTPTQIRYHRTPHAYDADDKDTLLFGSEGMISMPRRRHSRATLFDDKLDGQTIEIPKEYIGSHKYEKPPFNLLKKSPKTDGQTATRRSTAA